LRLILGVIYQNLCLTVHFGTEIC